MRIVVAAQAFKGTLSSISACQAIADGLLLAWPSANITISPMADGGDGTLETLTNSTHGIYHTTTATNPHGDAISATWSTMGGGRTAVIEMARASGLALLPKDCLNPRTATSYGTGELIQAALNAGVDRIILGLGGSATNDGGSGLMEALGIRFHDQNCEDLHRGGSALSKLHHIDDINLDQRFPNTKILVACDVTNTLLGPFGASAVYGPQKGASPEIVQELDEALTRYSQILKEYSGKDFTQTPGTGAAGGIAIALLTFGQVELRSGVEIVAESTGLAEKMNTADLVITGEGQIDKSTIFNKAPIGVAKLAKQRNIPVAAIAGSLGPGHEDVMSHGIDFLESIAGEHINLSTAMQEPYNSLRSTAERLGKKLTNSL